MATIAVRPDPSWWLRLVMGTARVLPASALAQTRLARRQSVRAVPDADAQACHRELVERILAKGSINEHA